MRHKKILLLISFLYAFVYSNAQTTYPNGFPVTHSTGWFRYGYVQGDSGTIAALRDTNWHPTFPGTSVFWQHAGVDSVGWTWDGFHWKRGGGVSTFNGRSGNVVLNSTDVTAALGYTPLSNITNYIQAGTNITFTGLGTLASPYVINSSGGGGGGTVTTFSFSNGNGVTGVVTNPTTTPSLSIGTSLTGIINGNGTSFSTVGIGAGLSYIGGTLSATGGTSLNGLVSANGSAFITTTIGAGLSYVGSTLTNTINNTNQLTNGAGFISNITGLISAGTNISITGSGTGISPYVINASGGTGTVTTFSSGNLSPLFTTSVTNPNTIPALAFSLSNAAANSVFGNNTGSSAAPVYYVPTLTTLNGWASGSIALLGTPNTWTAAQTFNSGIVMGSSITFSTDNSWNIGSLSAGAAHVWSRVFESDAGVSMASTSGSPASINIGAVPGITLLATQQVQFNNYTGSGFSGTANDSILTINPANGQIGWKWGQPFFIYAVEGTSPIGTHGDSIQFGGSGGPLYQPDTLFVQFQHLYFANMLGKSSLAGTDSLMIKTATGELLGVPTSVVGSVTSVAETVPSSFLTIGGSPIITSGTLAIGLANAPANSWWGNNTGSSAAPAYYTATQVTADLNLFTNSLQGLVPSSGGGTTKFLRADQTWAVPAGGGPTLVQGLNTQIMTDGGQTYVHSNNYLPSSDTLWIGYLGQSQLLYALSPIAQSDTVVNNKVFIYNRASNSFVVANPLNAPFPGISGSNIGCNIPWYIGKYLQQYTGKTIMLCGFAKSSQAISTFYIAGTGPQANLDTFYVYTAAANVQKYNLILWMQGENDPATGYSITGLAGGYMLTHDSLIANMRSQTFIPPMTPFLVGGMPKMAQGSTTDYHVIDTTLMHIGGGRDPRIKYVQTDSSQVNAGDIHYSNAGKKTFAYYAVQAYNEMQIYTAPPTFVKAVDFFAVTNDSSGNGAPSAQILAMNQHAYGTAEIDIQGSVNAYKGRFGLGNPNAVLSPFLGSSYTPPSMSTTINTLGDTYISSEVNRPLSFYVNYNLQLRMLNGGMELYGTYFRLNNGTASAGNTFYYWGDNNNSKFATSVANSTNNSAGAIASHYQMLNGTNSYIQAVDPFGRLTIGATASHDLAQLQVNPFTTVVPNGVGGVVATFTKAKLNDATTGVSGTIAHYSMLGMAADTLTSSNTGVTYTNATTLYIEGPPIAGNHVTETNSWPLYIGSGKSHFGGALQIQDGTQSNGFVLTSDANGNTSWQAASGSGVTTVGAFSGSSQTNGASISSTTITFGPADATNPGMIKASGSQTLGPALTLNGQLNISGGFTATIGTATDANYTVGTETEVHLVQITANRSVTMPTASSFTGRWLTISNYNTSAFNWTFPGTIVDATGTGFSINVFPNGATVNLYSDGTNWLIRSVQYSLTVLVSGGWQVSASTTASTISNNVTNYLINPASLIATYTLTLPSNPIDAQVVKVHFGGTITSGAVITSLTVSPNSGQTITGSSITTAAVSSCYIYTYNAALASWYREQ